MPQGILYGVSVGPGDPELLTLKAVRILQACEVLAVPRTGGERTLALDILRQAMDISRHEIVYLDFLMTKSPEAREGNHRENARKILHFLRAGRSVAMPNLGDVSVYSTYSYMARRAGDEGFETVMVPGVPSFCAAACALNISLTEMEKPLHLIPCSHDCLPDTQGLSGTKVFMKPPRDLSVLQRFFDDPGLDAAAVQNCGLSDEKLCRRAEELEHGRYFTTLIVKNKK